MLFKVHRFFQLFIFHLCLVYPLVLLGNSPLVLSDNQGRFQVGSYMSFLEDSKRELNFEQVLSPQYQKQFFQSPGDNPNFGSTDSVFWSHLKIKNNIKNSDIWYLELKGSLIRYVDFYYKVQGESPFRTVNTGVLRGNEKRDVSNRRFVFQFKLPYEKTAEVYFRVDTKWALFPLTLYTTKEFNKKNNSENVVFGVVYGTIFTIILFSIVAWILRRDSSFIYFACWLICITLFKLSIEGFGPLYIWSFFPDFSRFAYPLSLLLTYIFAIKFQSSFLIAKKNSPVFHQILIVVQLICLILLILMLFEYSTYLIQMVHLIGLICIPMMLIAAIQARWNGFKPATLYILGWIVLFASGMDGLLALWKKGTDYDTIENTLNIGVLLTAIFFSFALINRILLIIRQNERTQADAIKQAEAHEQFAIKKNKELETARVKALDAKQLAETANLAKSNFLTSVSHELRTPLHQIINLTQLLKEDIRPISNEHREYLVNHTLEAGNHLLKMIEDILDISNIELENIFVQYSEVSIRQVLENIIHNHGIKDIKSDISFSIAVAEELDGFSILTDEGLLKQALFNLLSNAAKFSNDGGEIHIVAEQVDNQLSVAIRDNGVGIAKDDQAKIFDPFFQVKGGTRDKTPGVGLGLTLSRKIIALLKGNIVVDSEGLGKGSCFTITLPF